MGSDLFLGLFVAILGLIFGSAVTGIGYRLAFPTKLSGSRSCCPHCGERLQIRDLIPVLSWVLNKKRCRYCNSAISYRYPMIELMVMAVCIIVYLSRKNEIDFIFHIAALLPLAILFYVDWFVYRLPSIAIYFYGFLGFIRIIYEELSIKDYAISIVLLGGVAFMLWKYFRPQGRQALGFGDVRLFTASGLWIAYPLVPWLMIWSSLIAIAMYFAIGQKGAVPFGPGIITALVGIWVFEGITAS